MSFLVHIKVFNEILDTFLNYLENEFPVFKSDLILTRTGVEFIRKNNPRLVVEQFVDMIKPYKTQIFNCDESFFLNYKLSYIGEETISLCTKVKDIWSCDTTTDEQKAHIWLFFQKLIKISDKI